ncbi:MAG: Teichoic acids export ATP-binding protein TagH [Firmicutes bacterium]|nr:Teichoic acids export ATP-binding protein TagH [Bacillota bacterium]
MIKAENLWKSFSMRRDKPGFKEFIVNAPKFLKNNNELFWALKGVSFSVKKGECLGVIGRNGAGKSTLLSLLLGVARPTKGSIEVSGKKTPLLELGAGFHPDMTGTENIIINGVLLGHTEAEVRARMDEITAFSELGDFINMPIRTYSSGMLMRLAFSIAIHTSPEVLLIDEILAVGDESFQKKSGKALLDLVKGGVTTVYVSHSMEAIKKICDRVIWLEQGEIRAEGETGQVVEEYLSVFRS